MEKLWVPIGYCWGRERLEHGGDVQRDYAPRMATPPWAVQSHLFCRHLDVMLTTSANIKILNRCSFIVFEIHSVAD